MKPIIVTNPEFNKPSRCVCAKCGKTFMKGAYSGTYSINGNYSYRYARMDGVPLVTLCDSCAEEELKAKRVGMLLY